MRAIETGLHALAQQRRARPSSELLGRTELLVHGTTIATNMLIQRTGPPVGLLCTEGFRDVLYFRDGYKPERFNIRLPHPEPLVPRHLRHRGAGADRPARRGARAARRARRCAPRPPTFRAAGVQAVAVAFLWSIANDAHERRACEILGEELPGVEVRRSSDVLPEIREWERTSATVLSAYVLPAIGDYLRRLEALLARAAGSRRAPLIMQINGGCCVDRRDPARAGQRRSPRVRRRRRPQRSTTRAGSASAT